ncbi:MAG: FAD-binding protein [Terracidiphilus sp.]
MENNRYDVVVVGAGIAGLCAAGVAAQQNLRVALAATGPGSFVLEPAWVKTPELSQEEDAGERNEALAFFCDMARRADSPLEADATGGRALPTLLGNFQSMALASRTLWNTAPRNGASMTVVGIRGLSGFDENFIAERFNETARKICSGCTYTAKQISFARDFGIPVSPVRVARSFDRDPAFRAEFAAALRKAASGCAVILLPGLLGMKSSAQRLAEFEREVGCTIGELPTLPPFIPSLRLFHRLEGYLRDSGVEFFHGYPVERLTIHDGSPLALEVAVPGRPLLLRGESVVLASGRHSAHLLGENCSGRDRDMRPLTAAGTVLAENLFVAGSLLDNGAGPGKGAMEILTGYLAGNLAAARRGCYAS